jgi:hypothetical protein
MEYAGALPAGQILAAVVRADRLLHKSSDGPLERWPEHCEEIARRALAESVARRQWAPAHASASQAE